jgi:hypothetical protein
MKNHRISISIFILSITLLLSSCGIFSLHPLFHKKDLLVRTDIIGTWQNDKDSKTLIYIDTLKDQMYKFTVIDDKDTIAFVMGLMKLDNQYFIDLFPDDDCSFTGGGDCEGLDNLFKNYIPAHTFMKFDVANNKIALTEFDNERLIKLFHENKIRLAHEIPGDKDDDDAYVVITASTDDLQKFITRYANDKDAFDETDNYHRLY